LASFGLRDTLQHSRKMRRINLLWLSLPTAQGQHGERDLILIVGRQPPHSFEGFFEQFCHREKIRSKRAKWKSVLGQSI
jgi:hypothetical protein